MPPEKDDTSLLWDMRIAGREARSFVAGRGYEAFIEDALLIHAIERELEILGEAARRISDTYRAAHPEIPWRSIIGLRNVLAHDYANVDLTSLWNTMQEELPQLLDWLDTALGLDA